MSWLPPLAPAIPGAVQQTAQAPANEDQPDRDDEPIRGTSRQEQRQPDQRAGDRQTNRADAESAIAARGHVTPVFCGVARELARGARRRTASELAGYTARRFGFTSRVPSPTAA